MIAGLIKGLIGFFAGNAGHKIGTVVADGAALVALTPVAIWLVANKDAVAVTLTYGQLAVFGLVLFAVVKVAHYTRAGRPEDRNGGQA